MCRKKIYYFIAVYTANLKNFLQFCSKNKLKVTVLQDLLCFLRQKGVKNQFFRWLSLKT